MLLLAEARVASHTAGLASLRTLRGSRRFAHCGVRVASHTAGLASLRTLRGSRRFAHCGAPSIIHVH